MGKMISVQSIAVAVAATGMTSADESRLFRFTIKHSVLMMIVMGLVSLLFAHNVPRRRAGGAAGSEARPCRHSLRLQNPAQQ